MANDNKRKLIFGRVIKYFIGVIVSIFLSLSALIVYNTNSHDIVMCALDDVYIVKVKKICTSYVKYIGVSDEFIDYINNENSITYLLNSSSDDKFVITEYLIEQGVSVNSFNMNDRLIDEGDRINLPPLHTVFLTDDLDSFKFLLSHDVDLNAVIEKTGEDIFSFGERIQASRPTENRAVMLSLIKK